jgi:hypothetical protein
MDHYFPPPGLFTYGPLSSPWDIKKTLILYFKALKLKLKYLKNNFYSLFPLSKEHPGLLAFQNKILMGYY